MLTNPRTVCSKLNIEKKAFHLEGVLSQSLIKKHWFWRKKKDIIIFHINFTVADKFSMDGLKVLTTFLISEKIREDNVVDTYVAATNSFPIIGNRTIIHVLYEL